MTAEDYMKLPKKRLAELLAEIDSLRYTSGINIPTYQPPCYSPDGVCTNPQMDCINCPRRGSETYQTNTFSTTTTPYNKKTFIINKENKL